jgi:hypothetical protein
MSFAGMRNFQQDLNGRVAGSGYRIDAGAVAEAMLRHPGVRRLLVADRGDRFSRLDGARTREPGPSRPRPGSA